MMKLALKIKIPDNEFTTTNNNSNNFTTNLNENLESENSCHHIIDNIYISNYKTSMDLDCLQKLNIINVINCAANSIKFSRKEHPGINYLQLDLKDDPGVDILFSILKAIDFIQKVKEGNILLHCFQVRRSIYFRGFLGHRQSWRVISCGRWR